MKKIIFDIIDAILFIIVLYLTVSVLTYFRISFNHLYVVAGLLIVWVVVKMVLRRLINNKKDKTNKNSQ